MPAGAVTQKTRRPRALQKQMWLSGACELSTISYTFSLGDGFSVRRTVFGRKAFGMPWGQRRVSTRRSLASELFSRWQCVWDFIQHRGQGCIMHKDRAQSSDRNLASESSRRNKGGFNERHYEARRFEGGRSDRWNCFHANRRGGGGLERSRSRTGRSDQGAALEAVHPVGVRKFRRKHQADRAKTRAEWIPLRHWPR
jgi:hypothetical protein